MSKSTSEIMAYLGIVVGGRETMKVKLTGQGLEHFPLEVLQLTKLKSLDLSDNSIPEISGDIALLAALQTLYVNNNKLESIPISVRTLTNLKDLQLSGNLLPEIPEFVGNLTNLTTLRADNNKLTFILASVGMLKSLSTLSFEENEVYSLPLELGSLSALTALDFDAPKLTNPPPEIVKDGVRRIIDYLRKMFGGRKSGNLKLHREGLVKVPTQIFELTALQSLDISDNLISLIPEDIGILTKLCTLNIERNEKVAHLPDTMSVLTNLTSLSLEGTDISHIPLWVGAFTSLIDLNLRGLHVDSPPEAVIMQGTPTVVKFLNRVMLSYGSGDLVLDSMRLDCLPIEVQKATMLKGLSLADNNFHMLEGSCPMKLAI
jgi:Leucine-rich repeat (LRR) protein